MIPGWGTPRRGEPPGRNGPKLSRSSSQRESDRQGVVVFPFVDRKPGPPKTRPWPSPQGGARIPIFLLHAGQNWPEGPAGRPPSVSYMVREPSPGRWAFATAPVAARRRAAG